MIVDIRDAFESLNVAIDNFNAKWVKHVIFAEVFETPLNHSGLAPKVITVTALTDEDAIHKSVDAFKIFCSILMPRPIVALTEMSSCKSF